MIEELNRQTENIAATEQTEEALALLTDLYQDIFEVIPELIDISWTQYEQEAEFTLDGIRFHIKQEFYEDLLDYPLNEITEYINKFGPITPNSLDWKNSINTFDILDLKKDTEFYIKVKTINQYLIEKPKVLLKRIFGINKKIEFSGEQFRITPL